MKNVRRQTLDVRSRIKPTRSMKLFSNFYVLPLTSYFFLFTLLTSCGYHIAGHQVKLPPGAKTIAVPTFENNTFEPSLEKIMTNDIRKEFLTQGRLELTHSTSDADLLLSGAIMRFERVPISFDPKRSVAIEYRIKILLEVTLRDMASNEILWEDPMIETAAEYLVSEDTSTTRVAQDRAISEASRHLAQNLVTRVLEGKTD